MENIEKFLTACKKFGLQDGDLFQTADLYECQNMSQVQYYTVTVELVISAGANFCGFTILDKFYGENFRGSSYVNPGLGIIVV